ncbi:MAG: peptidyl-arginine deiminase family protein [Acidobacteriaceae bacterium]|nr:peptidyl-arginine deiminase family protein [Acidobacteriaceae bacterium]
MTRSSAQNPPIRYRMPAEWEPHAATWLAWPHYKLDWPGKFEPIPWVYAEIIRYLSRNERVELIVKDAAAEKLARKTLQRAHTLNDNIRFHRWLTDRVWTRDSGCAFVWPCGADTPVRQTGAKAPVSSKAVSARLEAAPTQSSTPPQYAAVKWRFNAWAKYPNWKHDEKIGSLMARVAGANQIQPVAGKKRVVLEGGSIDVNGRGSLITTEECLLSRVQQRNPGMKRQDYEKIFAEYLGASNVIWIGSGIVGDDTHGHVDDITRFVSPDTVLTCLDADPQSENYEALRENLRRLRDATTEDGKPLATIDLPMPAPIYFEGRRLPASYANFYIANRVVLVPVFNDPNDRVALDILADIFPDRDVVGIYCGDLIWGFGAIHCMTQQQPALPK